MDSVSGRYEKWLLVLGVVLVAFNFRTPITSVSPVIDAIAADLNLGYAATSLLTTIPTLCFGVFAFASTSIGRRLGRDVGVLLGTSLLALGLLGRVWGGHVTVLFGTTVLVGVGIALDQSLLPSLISEHFPTNAGFATGLYTTALVIGAGVSSSVTPVIRDYVGSWSIALAAWSGPAVLAVLVWLPVVRSTTREDTASTAHDSSGRVGDGGRGVLPWRQSRAWLLTLFFGLQSTLFYTTVTWLAPRYVALGWTSRDAGFLLTVLFVGQLGGTLGLAPLSDRWTDRRPWLALVVLCCAAGFLGVALAPRFHPWITMLVLGTGLGGIFALNMTLPVDFGSDPAAANRITAMMTGVGYLIASVGPFAGGVIRDYSGTMRPVFVLLLAISAVLLGLSVTLDSTHPIQ